MKVKHKT